MPRWVVLAAVAGAVGVVWYVATWAVAGVVIEGYDPLRQAISETFATGAPAGAAGAMRVALVGTGVLLVLFSAAAHRGLPGTSPAGPVLIAASGIMTVAIVAAPCSPGCPGLGASPTDSWHTVIAAIGYLALIVAPLAVGHRVRAEEPGLAHWSFVLGGVAMAGFVVRNLAGVDTLGGLQQRFFNTVADAWYVVAAAVIVGRARRQGRTRPVPGGDERAGSWRS